MTVVDLWVNALSGKAAAAFMGQAGNEGIPELLGGDLGASSTLQHLLVTMDACGVDIGVLAAGIASEETETLLAAVAEHPDRLRVALTVENLRRTIQAFSFFHSSGFVGQPSCLVQLFFSLEYQ